MLDIVLLSGVTGRNGWKVTGGEIVVLVVCRVGREEEASVVKGLST